MGTFDGFISDVSKVKSGLVLKSRRFRYLFLFDWHSNYNVDIDVHETPHEIQQVSRMLFISVPIAKM